MSAWQPPKGSREIDRVIDGVGRFRLRTGTKNARRAQAYDQMLDDLPLDLVRLLLTKDAKGRHVITLRQLYDLKQAGKPLPSADALRPLFPAMEAWTEKPLAPVGTRETQSREATVKALRALVTNEPHVLNLPAIAKQLFVQHRDAGQGAAWNRRKAVILAFLRDTFSKQSEIYKTVQGLPRLKEPPKFTRHPCTVAEAKAHAIALGPKWGPQWWTLCLTGMNPSEHWEDGWKVLSVGIELLGEKRPARHRIIPNVGTPVPPVGTKAGFAEAVERAGLGITPRDARRSYARWLEETGIPLYRRKAYMGHGPKSMTELYTWGDITAWLNEDTRTLARYLGTPMLRMEEA